MDGTKTMPAREVEEEERAFLFGALAQPRARIGNSLARVIEVLKIWILFKTGRVLNALGPRFVRHGSGSFVRGDFCFTGNRPRTACAGWKGGGKKWERGTT